MKNKRLFVLLLTLLLGFGTSMNNSWGKSDNFPEIQELRQLKKRLVTLNQMISDQQAQKDPLTARVAIANLFLKYVKRDLSVENSRDMGLRNLSWLRQVVPALEKTKITFRRKTFSKLAHGQSGSNTEPLTISHGYFRDVNGKPCLLSGFTYSGTPNPYKDDILDLWEILGVNLVNLTVIPNKFIDDDRQLNLNTVNAYRKLMDVLNKRGMYVNLNLKHRFGKKFGTWNKLLPKVNPAVIQLREIDPVESFWIKILPQLKVLAVPNLVAVNLANEPSFRHTGKLLDTKHLRLEELIDLQLRVSNFFHALNRRVQQVWNVPTHVKISNRHLFNTRRRTDSGLQREGIDYLRITNGLSLSGFDTRLLPSDKKYVMDWLDLSQAYDLAVSFFPNKPIFDSELHLFDTVYYKNDNISPNHVRSSLWFAHINGLAGHILWWWGRLDNQPKKRWFKKWFRGSLLTQGWLLDAYVSTMREIRSRPDLFERFRNSRRRIGIVYTNAFALQDTGYLKSVRAIHEAVSFIGESIDYVTCEDTVHHAKASDRPMILFVPMVEGGAEYFKAHKACLKELSGDNPIVFIGPHKEMAPLVAAFEKAQYKYINAPPAAKRQAWQQRLRNLSLKALKKSPDQSLIVPVTGDKNTTLWWRVSRTREGLAIFVINLGLKSQDYCLNPQSTLRAVNQSFTVKAGIEKTMHLAPGDFEIYIE